MTWRTWRVEELEMGPERTTTSAAELFFHNHLRSAAVSARGARGTGGKTSSSSKVYVGWFGCEAGVGWSYVHICVTSIDIEILVAPGVWGRIVAAVALPLLGSAVPGINGRGSRCLLMESLW